MDARIRSAVSSLFAGLRSASCSLRERSKAAGSPPLAEACYLRRDYAGARAALAQFSNRSPLPLLRPLLRYWTS